MAKYDLDTTTLATLLENPEVVAIMEKHSPGITSNPMIGMAKGMTANQVMGMAGGVIGTENAQAIRRDVAAL
ncbi:MAG: hypothetical protein H0V10_16040 [Geodermatophilaceae bacterium]|nr:hypothetical protein [Geodermatophilaceae bacterium]